jgi:hypothetical protein
MSSVQENIEERELGSVIVVEPNVAPSSTSQTPTVVSAEILMA